MQLIIVVNLIELFSRKLPLYAPNLDTLKIFYFMTSSPRYFNSHAHCFTIDHVPENFFDELIGGRRFLRISKIEKSKFLQWVLKLLTGNFGRCMIGLFSKKAARQLRRLNGLLKYSTEKTQLDLIENLRQYYQENYRYVFLSMDMQYMGAGNPSEDFLAQLKD